MRSLTTARPAQSPRIKLCGLTRLEDIEYANRHKPDFVGFVFAPSPRRISVRKAQRLKKLLDEGIQVVGVFVDEDIDSVALLAKQGIIDLIQLHGAEDAGYIEKLRARTDVPLIKSVSVTSRDDILDALGSPADHLLFDNGPGGSGTTFDWTLLKECEDRLEDGYFLAGGLDCENVTAALDTLQPYAVDTSSGIESDGRKDHRKIERFIDAIRTHHEKRNVATVHPHSGVSEAKSHQPFKEDAERCLVNKMNVSQEKEMSEGRFGAYGGQYVPETLMSAIQELEDVYDIARSDPEFQAEFADLLHTYAGRPTPLYFAQKMTDDLGGARIYLKREDMNHTGSHKINNVLGQVLLAKRMGKTRIIAETGAGQHGVATATAAALMGLECEVYMGQEDCQRQALNVYRMELLGATVHPVTSGTQTLKDAVSETMREWVSRMHDTHYVLGSVMGPHPFPTMVRDFQKVIGKEIRQQLPVNESEARDGGTRDRTRSKGYERLPDVIIACVGGGSNAIGAFHEFLDEPTVELIACEAAGMGIDTDQHAATISKGSVGILHGMKSYFCQDDYGQIMPVYSISAGLDYPGLGPEHAYLADVGRVDYVAITDDEAIEAFEYLSRTEGVIPAIESAHAVAHAMRLAPTMDKDKIIVVNLSGRGDKDVASIARHRGVEIDE